MTLAASPAIQLSADGGTWLAPGAPLQVAAGAPFYARLNSIANVDSTAWAVLTTDDVGTAPALTPSGIVNSVVTGTAGAVGTSFILESTINAGQDKTTNTENPLTTTATALVWVAATNGLRVICFDEHAEAGPQWWIPAVNAAIRGAGGGGAALAGTSLALGGQVPPQVQVKPGTTQQTTNASTVTLATIPVASGAGGRLRCVITAKMVGANATSWALSIFEIFAIFKSPSGVLAVSPPVVSSSSYLGEPLCGVANGGLPGVAASGSNLVVSATGPTPASVQAPYSNSLAVVALGGSVPSGICIVSNGGGLYLVTTGGTTASTGSGPTGTGGSIAEGGGSPVVYSYIGPAAAGIVFNWTCAIPELVSG